MSDFKLVSRWAKGLADTDDAEAEAQRTGRIMYALMEQGYLTQESYNRHTVSYYWVRLCCRFVDDPAPAAAPAADEPVTEGSAAAKEPKEEPPTIACAAAPAAARGEETESWYFYFLAAVSYTHLTLPTSDLV
mgnify:CR=1 FL=1